MIIHQAAIRSVPKSLDNPFLSNSVNSEGTLMMLHEAARCGIRRFVYASSSSVYGNAQHFPQREDFPTRPLSPYGASKLAGENFCYSYFFNFGLETVSLRYFNVYGPRQNPESKYSAVVPAFVSSVRKKMQPTIDGTGKQSRDFTFVRDVAKANILAAFTPDIAGQIFNIAGGKDYSVLKVYKMICDALGSSLKPVFGQRRRGDPMRTYADTSKARRMLKWRPEVEFEEGLNETIEWFLKKRV